TRSDRDWSSDVCSSDLIRKNLVEILQPEPLAREARRQGFRSLVSEHPPHLLLDTDRGAQCAGIRRLHELGVWTAVPQEEGKPREIGRASCRERVSISAV